MSKDILEIVAELNQEFCCFLYALRAFVKELSLDLCSWQGHRPGKKKKEKERGNKKVLTLVQPSPGTNKAGHRGPWEREKGDKGRKVVDGSK